MSIRVHRKRYRITTALWLLGAVLLAPSAAPTANDFSISASPTSVTIAQGNAGTASISTALTSGTAQTVALSVSGAPAGASAGFTPSSVTTGGSSTLNITVTTASPGTYTLTITGTAASGSHTTTVSLTVTGATPDRPQTWGNVKAHYR